jgi:hypothetical protein
MTDSLAVVLGALVGSGMTGIGVIISNALQRKADERRQIRELAVKVATENWRHQSEIGKAWAEGGAKVTLPALDVYLIHAMSLVKTLDGSVHTPEQVTTLLRESFAMSKAAPKEINTRNHQQ